MMNTVFFLHADHQLNSGSNSLNAESILHDENTAEKNIQVFLQTLKPESYVQFKTCLRTLCFINESDLTEEQKFFLQSIQFQVYKDDVGIDFLINLLCGLKSRIIGETEIFGQFKKFVETLSSNQKQIFLNVNLTKFIFESVKEIRDHHIKTWGVHSYGSMIRKLVKNFKSIDMLGYGHLGQEVQPWLESKSLNVFVRQPEKIKAEFNELKSVLAYGADQFKGEVLILAAPLNSAELLAKIEKSAGAIKLIIDCRALDQTSTSLKSKTSIETIELHDLFKSLEVEQTGLSEKLEAVKNIIFDKVLKFSLREAHRPLGWDDLCL